MKCGIIFNKTGDLWPSLKNHQSPEELDSELFSYFPFTAPYGNQTTYYSFYKLAQSILKEKPSHLFFNSERPHPSVILSFLAMLDPHYLPEVGIRVFGNFQESLGEWFRNEKWVNRLKISFYSPSQAQSRLVSHFLNSTDIITTLPHPVKLMKRDFTLRQETRAKFNINNEVIFLYSGRLSMQKNVHYIFSLIKELNDIHAPILKNGFKVYIAGSLDDKGSPALNITPLEGDYYQRLMSELQKLPNELQKNFHFLGNVSRSQLEKLYNASDFLVNFSLNHAEAYGAAIAEALSTGLPCLLSAWGGHGDFIKNFPTACLPLYPEMCSHGLRLKFDLNFLNKIESYIHTSDQRENLSQVVLTHFQDKDLKHMIQTFLCFEGQHFQGFNHHLNDFLTARNSLNAFDSRSPEYQKTFQRYITPMKDAT